MVGKVPSEFRGSVSICDFCGTISSYSIDVTPTSEGLFLPNGVLGSIWWNLTGDSPVMIVNYVLGEKTLFWGGR